MRSRVHVSHRTFSVAVAMLALTILPIFGTADTDQAIRM
jgi:hypothetical protein